MVMKTKKGTKMPMEADTMLEIVMGPTGRITGVEGLHVTGESIPRTNVAAICATTTTTVRLLKKRVRASY